MPSGRWRSSASRPYSVSRRRRTFLDADAGMAGLKSAARMRLRAPASISGLLDDLNAVLLEIERPNMFATAAPAVDFVKHLFYTSV